MLKIYVRLPSRLLSAFVFLFSFLCGFSEYFGLFDDVNIQPYFITTKLFYMLLNIFDRFCPKEKPRLRSRGERMSLTTSHLEIDPDRSIEPNL
jgi:hypothetical protein